MFLSDIYKIINYEGEYCNRKINNIRIDSRLLEKDDVFICINSGYKYIQSAIRKNVALIITDKNVEYVTDIPIIKVENSIITLGLVARYIRSKYNGKVIAITGSVGKTTTKELISYILESKYKVLKTINSFNNNIGVPTTLLQLDDTYNFAVLELGSNHPGEIKYLTDIVNPDISIITNIGTSHIGNFENMNNILKEKLDIKKDGLLFLNGEDKLLNVIDGIKVYKDDYNYVPSVEHLKMDYYIAFKVCEYLGFDRESLYKISNKFTLNNSRMEVIKLENIILIDDTYNASFESVVAGINSLKSYDSKLIILADMLELGNMSIKLHSNLQKYIDLLDNCTLITLGEYTSILKSKKHFYNLDDLNSYLANIDYSKYNVIYIKGAHKMNLGKTVSLLIKILQKN